MKLEDYGVCPKTGKFLNPFGVKPEWVFKKAAELQQKWTVANADEAPF